MPRWSWETVPSGRCFSLLPLLVPGSQQVWWALRKRSLGSYSSSLSPTCSKPGKETVFLVSDPGLRCPVCGSRSPGLYNHPPVLWPLLGSQFSTWSHLFPFNLSPVDLFFIAFVVENNWNRSLKSGQKALLKTIRKCILQGQIFSFM